MTTSAATGGKLLLLANRARFNPSLASAYDLWRLADWEANSERKERISRYRHGLIHAGRLPGPDGDGYPVCPVCDEKLTLE